MIFFNYIATKVWFSNTHIFVQLSDDRIGSLPIANFPLLKKASAHQLQNFEIINGYALYWQSIGEDLSVAGFFEK
jgi:Protein of unknown function (DUF2442)